MSLSIMRTLEGRLSFDHIKNSLRGTRFLPLLFDIKPELEGCVYWPISFKDDYTYYLERFNNRSVLTSL